MNYLLNFLAIKRKNKKYFLIISVFLNLTLLSFFKYYNFIIDNLNALFDFQISHIELDIPLAISFYTFQQIAFMVDLFRSHIKKLNFLDYIFFVTFFPQLIAGPIVHHSEIFPQLKKKLIFKLENLNTGLKIFFIGLAKKVIIADFFSVWADRVFENPELIDFTQAWIGVLSYGIQIYFDFSAYSDMAVGLGFVFGIYLPWNFNSPYKASDITDFWRRWHITLSRFLRDYVYIPLGGNRGKKWSQYQNILITMLLGGLWHGPSWNFVIWGGIHAMALILHKLWCKLKPAKIENVFGYHFVCHLVTISLVFWSWIFFRANDLEKVKIICNKLLELPLNFSYLSLINLKQDFLNYFNDDNAIFLLWIFSNPITAWACLFLCQVTILLSTRFKNTREIITLNPNFSYRSTTGSILVILILYIIQNFLSVTNEFIYFKF